MVAKVSSHSFSTGLMVAKVSSHSFSTRPINPIFLPSHSTICFLAPPASGCPVYQAYLPALPLNNMLPSTPCQWLPGLQVHHVGHQPGEVGPVHQPRESLQPEVKVMVAIDCTVRAQHVDHGHHLLPLGEGAHDAGSKDVSREENERVEVAELLDSCQEPSCSPHWLHVPLLHIVDIIKVHQGDGVSSFVRIQHCLFRLLRSPVSPAPE